MTAWHERTAVELRAALAAGEVSPTELVEHVLARIAARDGDLGAFVTVTADGARARAASLEAAGVRARGAGSPAEGAAEERGGGARRPDAGDTSPRAGLPSPVLWGLPSADKDLTDRAGVPTAFGSRAFSGAHRYVPETSSDVVQVLDAAGMVSVGKTSTPELGLCSTTEPLAGPVARNPWDLTRGAGGSSGGAAVAVAAGLVPVAVGSDGGGSVRIPAAACGLVGLKPTRGLLPAGGGVESLAGLVVHGPLARTTQDAALVLEALLPRTADGRVDHPRTLRTVAGSAGSYLAAARDGRTRDGGGAYRVAVTTSSAWDATYDVVLHPEARAALDLAADLLSDDGHRVSESPGWEPDESFGRAFRVVWMAGAADVPLDGADRLALVEPLTRWLIEQGRALPSRVLLDALTTLAGFERTLVGRLHEADVLLTPATALPPRPLGWYVPDDPEHNFEQQCRYTPYTSMINVAGLPAITVPVRWTAPEGTAPAGLPMGVQLVGRPGGEDVLLALAARLEDRLHWAERRPPVW